MEPPVLATASAGIFIFSLIRSWLWGRVMKCQGTGHTEPDRVK
jgi:hypothetical protein